MYVQFFNFNRLLILYLISKFLKYVVNIIKLDIQGVLVISRNDLKKYVPKNISLNKNAWVF